MAAEPVQNRGSGELARPSNRANPHVSRASSGPGAIGGLPDQLAVGPVNRLEPLREARSIFHWPQSKSR